MYPWLFDEARGGERMSEYIWTLDGASQIIHLTTGQTARDAHRSTLCYNVEFCRRRSPLPPPSLPPTFSRPQHHSLARWGFSRLMPPPPSVACKSNSEQMWIVIPLPPPWLTVVVAGCLAAVWFEGALDGSAEGPGEDGNTKRFNLFLSLSVPLQTHGRSLFPL